MNDYGLQFDPTCQTCHQLADTWDEAATTWLVAIETITGPERPEVLTATGEAALAARDAYYGHLAVHTTTPTSPGDARTAILALGVTGPHSPTDPSALLPFLGVDV